MVDIAPNKSRGRPRSFDPDDALDKAVNLFWRRGYDATDVDAIARAVGVTKPSLYRLFGDKQQLFLKALERYGVTTGAAPLAAFTTASDVRSAVRAFLAAALAGNTRQDAPSGCLFACVAASVAENQPETRSFYARGLEITATVLAARFSKAALSGELKADFPSEERARLLVDFMQATALRARAGESVERLEEQLPLHTNLVLG